MLVKTLQCCQKACINNIVHCLQVENGNEEVVHELLLQGANVDLQDSVSIYVHVQCIYMYMYVHMYSYMYIYMYIYKLYIYTCTTYIVYTCTCTCTLYMGGGFMILLF